MYTPSTELLPRSTWRRQQLKNGTFSAEARAVKPGNMVPSAIQHKRPTPFTPVKWVGKHAEKGLLPCITPAELSEALRAGQLRQAHCQCQQGSCNACHADLQHSRKDRLGLLSGICRGWLHNEGSQPNGIPKPREGRLGKRLREEIC
jgi:hypothetical protein